MDAAVAMKIIIIIANSLLVLQRLGAERKVHYFFKVCVG